MPPTVAVTLARLLRPRMPVPNRTSAACVPSSPTFVTVGQFPMNHRQGESTDVIV